MSITTTATETVRDLDWYVANAGRVQEMDTEATRLEKLADNAILAANDARRNTVALARVSEMFEGHPIRFAENPAPAANVQVRSPLTGFGANAYESQHEGDTTWSVNIEDFTHVSETKVHLNRTSVGGDVVHNLTREDAILAAKRWVAFGIDPR